MAITARNNCSRKARGLAKKDQRKGQRYLKWI